MNTIDRKLTTVYTPESQQGFLGNGHIARPVIAIDFSQSDPFIMLMDDILDKTDHTPAGGPHPHGGFETVSLVLSGDIGEGAHALKAGDFEIMTAGSGIVHTETISKPTKLRLLQLWLNLPKEKRKATPRIQRLVSGHIPTSDTGGVSTRVYSGNLAGLTSPIKNHTPLTIAEIRIEPGVSTTVDLPADFSTFLYVIEGNMQVGGGNRGLLKDEVGWLDRHEETGSSQLKITAGKEGVHFVLYAAQPQRHQIVSHGPFIADTMEDIRQLYSDFRSGRMGHITEVSSEQQFAY